tara:strand:- start:92 stop:568 length:477 start_codon:yes stop_codon:yes gene_type:complete
MVRNMTISSDVRERAKIFAKTIPNEPGIYIAQPIGSRMRVIDKSRTHIMPSVNNSHIKVGKAKSLSSRSKNYFWDNDGDIIFKPVIVSKNMSSAQLSGLEKMLKSAFFDFRIINPKTNRRLEWMTNISCEEAELIIKDTYKKFLQIIENETNLNSNQK